MNYLLAGPFPLIDSDSNPLHPSNTAERSAYYPGYGWFMALHINGSDYVCGVTLDGVAEIVSEYIHNSYVWDDVNQVYVLNSYTIDRTGFCRHYYYDMEGHLSLPVAFTTTSVALASDRALRADYVVDGVRIFTDLVTVGTTYTGPGRAQGELTFALGRYLRFYDYRNKVVTSRVMLLGPNTQMAYYDTDNGVILTLNQDPGTLVWSTSVWALEMVPDHISTVTVKTGDPTVGGYVVYEVQVFGAQNDVSDGIPVDWTITGPGHLIDTRSYTDINGFALCRVVYFGAGSSTVEASITC